MVSGRVAKPTVGTAVSQCGLTTTMARGVSKRAASSVMAAPAAPGCRANMGEPWGTNKTERMEVMVFELVKVAGLRGRRPLLQKGRKAWIGL